jgi:hypothetical protein
MPELMHTLDPLAVVAVIVGVTFPMLLVAVAALLNAKLPLVEREDAGDTHAGPPKMDQSQHMERACDQVLGAGAHRRSARRISE